MMPLLIFWNEELELAFAEHQRQGASGVATRFALFRATLLLFTALRALWEVQQWGRELLLLVGAASNVLPLWAACTPANSRHAWLARWGAVGTEVVQAVIGAANHQFMAPSHAGMQPAQALVYLLHGSTALWMVCYASFSTLPFPMLLVQQTLVAMVLLAGSGSMCEESEGLRAGYVALHALLQRARQAAQHWGRLLPASWPAVVSALAPSMPWCPASDAANASYSGAAAAGGTAAAGVAAMRPDAAVRLCLDYQLPALLLGGFALSTWLAYRAERRSRIAWLRGLLQRDLGGSVGASGAGIGGGDGTPGGGSSGGGADAAAAAAAWRHEIELELVEPLPNDLDFWLQIALPCLLCIGMVARCIV